MIDTDLIPHILDRVPHTLYRKTLTAQSEPSPYHIHMCAMMHSVSGQRRCKTVIFVETKREWFFISKSTERAACF